MQLTTKQQYWLSHITAVQQSKQTISVYAAQHNLCVKALYSWKWQLKKLNIPVAKNENPFIKITVSEIPSATISGIDVKVILPNGIALQLPQLTAETLSMLLSV
jgi:hypothetical protein